jgi:alkylhydroperoxidase family enzyme
MARIPYLSAADLAAGDRELLSRDLNLYRALAHSPAAARAFAAPALYMRHDSPLDQRLRELAILQVGYTTKTRYEYAHHIEIGLRAGLSPDDIRAISLASAGLPSHLGELERAVLDTARELVAAPALSDACYARLSALLDTPHLVDLIMVISVYCGVVRLLGALEIDLEESYETYLKDYPLPP